MRLRHSTRNYIKQILRDYPQIDRYIKEREEELRVPYRETDLNADIKGNRISDSMANMMITIEIDRRLSLLERNKRIVGDNLAECDKDTRIIIEELYMAKYPKYTLDGLIANGLIHVSRRQAFYLRDNFFSNVAADLNLEV